MKIYTTGYHGGPGSKSDRTLENLKALCERRGLFVADIRLRAWSRNPTFTRETMMSFLGDGYRWVPELGNLNYVEGGEVRIADFRSGALTLQELHRLTGLSPLLLCECTDFNQCHREDVANRLLSEGLAESIEEISRWGE